MGALSSAARPPRHGGFTLIELLVALVVAGIAIAMVALGGVGMSDRGLRFEAERLSQLLSLARDEAQVRGRPIRLQADETGYRFVMLTDRQWRPIVDDTDLRARTWDEPTRLTVRRPDGRVDIEFGRDSVDVPFEVLVSRGDTGVAIHANGLGLFEVR